MLARLTLTWPYFAAGRSIYSIEFASGTTRVAVSGETYLIAHASLPQFNVFEVHVNGIMLIGYDVEARGEEDVTPCFLEQARVIHNRLEVPATLFIVGQTLEQWVPEFQAIAADSLFDLQQHTYSHQLLKTVHIDDGKSIRVVRGVSPEETRQEVRKTSELLRKHLGVECIGLTGPWCYYRGLRDRPDILEILWQEGIRFTRTDGRNQHDWHPVSMDLQPYWYDALGFPEMLEIPIHGWHDCVIRDEVLGWENLEGYVDSVKPYIDRAAAEGKVFSLCQHDWSSMREDRQMHATETLIRYAQAQGLRFMTYRAYYEERIHIAATSLANSRQPGLSR